MSETLSSLKQAFIALQNMQAELDQVKQARSRYGTAGRPTSDIAVRVRSLRSPLCRTSASYLGQGFRDPRRAISTKHNDFKALTPWPAPCI